MDATFGWNLDGQCFPETAAGGAATINAAVVGPRGLLGLLETKLGLRRPGAHRALRIAQYLAALKNVDDGKQYYSASLKVDPWATADRLLQARDELVAAGWNKQPLDGVAKLAALAAVETGGAIPDGFGERFNDVFAFLQDNKRESPFEKLRIVGGSEHLPKRWQQLLQLLSESGTVIEELHCSPIAGDSDLAIIQNLVTTRATTTLSVRGDGTFTIIDADDELQAAELVAAWLKHHANHREVVIVRGRDSSALNLACLRFGLPALGTTERSEFRSVLQVLPFAFEMAWRPIDPRRLAEFITLDGGPIPNSLNYELLNALQEQLGVGGPLWQQAWQNILKREITEAQSADASKSLNDAERDAKAKVAGWQAWFNSKAKSYNDEIDVEDARAICQRVQRWATQRAQFADQSRSRLYEMSAAHAKLLEHLITVTQQSRIGLTQLRKMTSAVTEYGATLSGAEIADWNLVDQAGQIWHHAPTVLWWQFAQSSAQSVKLSAWSSDEIDQLAQHGIHIESSLARLRRDNLTWRAPLLNARERLIIVKPRMVAGEDAVPHPLWDEIASLVDEKQLRRATVQAGDLYNKAALAFAGVEIACQPQSAFALPSVHRNWVLSPGVVTPREREESFSSIDKLLGCSLAWVLEYRGQMRQPKALELSQKEMLVGKLAHAVINEIYKEKKKWLPKEARQRAEQILKTFIPERAAPLLLPGAGPQLRQASEAIPAAIEHLTKVINEASLRVDDTEVHLSAQFSKERALAGGADMLAYTPQNVPVILDFKWSSSPLWFRKKIAKGQALQLAVYAYLALHLKGATGDIEAKDWPPVGYFMLRGKEMYFTKDGVFPPGSHVRKQERSMKETWEVTVAQYERELATILSGHVTAYGVDPDNARLEDFMRVDLTDPPCRFCNLGYLCGKRELQ